jgi:rhodanese-related sulfurtransferase
MSRKLKLFLVFALTVLVSVGASFTLFNYWMSRPEQLMRAFYAGEMATVVSPTTIKKYIDEGNTNYILVDLRSQGEYEKEHIKSAVNIPASSMNTDQLVEAFKKLGTDKEIIVHCYSAYCTLGRQVGRALSERGIYVKELTAGWSEWRYHWDILNGGAKPEDNAKYLETGKADPTTTPIIPCTEGEFGC